VVSQNSWLPTMGSEDLVRPHVVDRVRNSDTDHIDSALIV
jgi:hypothetical protein